MSLDWKKDVLAKAVQTAQKIREEKPYLSVPAAMTEAWQDPQVMSIRERYNKQQEQMGRRKKPAKH